jgi:hypothetical protein
LEFNNANARRLVFSTFSYYLPRVVFVAVEVSPIRVGSVLAHVLDSPADVKGALLNYCLFLATLNASRDVMPNPVKGIHERTSRRLRITTGVPETLAKVPVR